jgi:multiple sugar transport system substrate-binding protein
MDRKLGAMQSVRRRDLLLATAAASLLRGHRAAAQASGPWAIPPKTKVDKLNFVVWTYGDIYTKISAKFKATGAFQ